MSRKLCAATLLLATAALADDLPRKVLMLSQFNQKIRQSLEQLPNYTCLETIQRFERPLLTHVFQPLDTVVLEISTVDDQELVARPGGRRSKETDLSAFAAGGLMGGGIFALHARNVFLNDGTKIHFHGDERIATHPVARYDFRVPPLWSRFRIRSRNGAVVIGTKGSFWIDPASLELIRLEVLAEELPGALDISQAQTRIDYTRVRIGTADVLLPKGAELIVTMSAGDATRNVIEFSHCREYHLPSSPRTP